VPGPVGSPVEFQVSLPESLTKPNVVDVEKLANLISKTYREMVDSNQSTVPENISDAILDYVKENKTTIPDDVHVMIETIKDLKRPSPDIIIGPGTNKNSLDAKVRLPGAIDNNVDFHVPLPKSSDDKDAIDSDALTEPCVCPLCSDVKDVYNFFNYYEMLKNKETDKIEETMVWKKYNTTMGFHNLYLQLEYLEIVQRILSCGIPEAYQEFFPKKISDNLYFLARVFENPKKDWIGELNVRFLDAHIKKEMASHVKDNEVGVGVLAGI
jgi:hypothetical protein